MAIMKSCFYSVLDSTMTYKDKMWSHLKSRMHRVMMSEGGSRRIFQPWDLMIVKQVMSKEGNTQEINTASKRILQSDVGKWIEHMHHLGDTINTMIDKETRQDIEQVGYENDKAAAGSSV
jgi:hypothetical protein